MENVKEGIVICTEQESKDLLSQREFYPVDTWHPLTAAQELVRTSKGQFIAPLSRVFNLPIDPKAKFDNFVLSTKKCYNSLEMRDHLYQYINYFEAYYDTDKEYLAVLYYLKTIIDKYDMHAYPQIAFFNDMERYILRSNIQEKVARMVDDNYNLTLDYVNVRNPSLQYSDYHAKLLFRMSILMDLVIPLLTNYAYMHRIDNIDEFLIGFFDRILNLYEVDIYSKLYETAYTNIKTNQKTNQGVWDKQDIRSIDITTHSTHSVRNIILNIMPRYTFTRNIISFNTASIRENTKYNVTDIGFDYTYNAQSSSKRDEDSVSEFDRFEANLIKQNEALYLQNKVNYQNVIDTIEYQFGPFDEDEIDLYIKRTMTDENGEPIINGFQKNLVFDMFYKYFRDVQSIYAINRREFAELIIAAKRILLSKGMILLPYILSGKVDKLVSRKSVNKRELQMIEAFDEYQKVMEKYQNDSILKYIRSIVATIISSEFSIVDPDPTIDGTHIEVVPDMIIEEVLTYVLLC